MSPERCWQGFEPWPVNKQVDKSGIKFVPPTVIEANCPTIYFFFCKLIIFREASLMV